MEDLIPIKLNVNGEIHELNVKPHWSLLRVLRDELGLTGAKLGCGTGECGACTVLIDGKAVNSCLVLAAQAEDKKIITIEGLARDGSLHPIQEAFIEYGAIQCGFCTPGMVLSAKALLDENPSPTEEAVRDAFRGNLCRCTGYVKPIEAVLAAAKAIKKVEKSKNGELLIVGRRLPRVDAFAKVTGRGKFTVDMKLPGMLYAKILRSHYAHAEVVKVDTSKAEKLPGVEAIITIKDVPRVLYGSKPSSHGLTVKDQHIFDKKVRFVGDGVAAVAAVSEDVAEEALKLIDVEYKILPAVFDVEEAMKPDAPEIHSEVPEVKHNILPVITSEFGDVEKGFKEADYIFEDEFKTSRQCHCSPEPHVYISSFDASGKLTVWASSQAPFYIRGLLAEVLNMPISKVRVVSGPYMGGGFGSKLDVYQDVFVCSVLAKKTGRPVKLTYTREEEFYATRTRHIVIVKLKQGIKKDGTIIAREASYIANTGAYASHGPGIVVLGVSMLGSLYRCSNIKIEGICVYTNTPIAGACRGYGGPQAHFALESQMDIVADKLGIDPIELRLKNRVRTGDMGPYGVPITSCGLMECIRKGAEKIGWERRQRKPGEVGTVKKRGIGMACVIHNSGAFPNLKEQGNAFIMLNEDGTVDLKVGTTEIGTGSTTALAQIAAEELGVRFEDVYVTAGDTDATPLGTSVAASKTIYVVGGAVKAAAADLKRQLLDRASKMLGIVPEDLEVIDSRIYVKRAPEKGILISDVVKDGICNFPVRTFMSKINYQPQQAHPFGAQFAEVEVDTEIGQVKVLRVVAAYDLGRAINPELVEGQVEGALQNSLGYALTEGLNLDEDGRALNRTFLDYKVFTAIDMPKIEIIIVEPIDPTGPFGAKGVGEIGFHPTAPAIANAIYNATGVRIKELSMTRERVWLKIRDSRALI